MTYERGIKQFGEQNLVDVTTYSIGQVRVAGRVGTYYGTQTMTTNHHGAEVYGGSDLTVVRGGFDTLLALPLSGDAKLAIETGHTRMADPPTDVWYRPYDFKQDVEAAMRQYLDWEGDLVPQVKRDGDAAFAVFKR